MQFYNNKNKTADSNAQNWSIETMTEFSILPSLELMY